MKICGTLLVLTMTWSSNTDQRRRGVVIRFIQKRQIQLEIILLLSDQHGKFDSPDYGLDLSPVIFSRQGHHVRAMEEETVELREAINPDHLSSEGRECHCDIPH